MDKGIIIFSLAFLLLSCSSTDRSYEELERLVAEKDKQIAQQEKQIRDQERKLNENAEAMEKYAGEITALERKSIGDIIANQITKIFWQNYPDLEEHQIGIRWLIIQPYSDQSVDIYFLQFNSKKETENLAKVNIYKGPLYGGVRGFIEYDPANPEGHYGPPLSIWAAGRDTYYITFEDHKVHLMHNEYAEVVPIRTSDGETIMPDYTSPPDKVLHTFEMDSDKEILLFEPWYLTLENTYDEMINR